MPSERKETKFDRKHAAVARAREQKQAAQRRFLIVGAIGALLLLLAAGLFAKRHSIRDHIYANRADDLLEAALANEAAGDLEAAGEKLGQAYRLKPRDPDIMRAIVSVQKDNAPASAADFLRALESAGFATPDDERQLLELEVRQGRFKSAAPLAAHLLEQFPEDALVLELAAKTQLALGDLEAARDLLRKARSLAPDNLELQLTYARLQLQSPLGDIRSVAWESIFKIVKKDPEGPIGLEGLKLIFAGRKNLLVPTNQYFELFKNHPLRPVDVDPTLPLLNWEFDLLTDPEARAARAKEAVAAWAAAEDLDRNELDRRLAWLNALGLSEVVFDFISSHEGPGNKDDLIAATLGALIDQKQFEEAAAVIDELRGTQSEAMAAGFNAILLHAQGRPQDQVDDEIRQATLLAAEEASPETLLRIGNMALRFHRDAEATHAFELAAKSAPAPAYQALASIAERQNDLDALLKHLKALALYQPDNTGLRSRTVYLQLLLQTDLESALNMINHLLRADPANPDYALLKAFAHLRYREIDQALALAQNIDPTSIPERFRPALVAIYHAAGDPATAQTLTADISTVSFSPLEKQLLDPQTASRAP